VNIAVLPSSYEPHIGGVEELSRQLARSYVRKGHRVVVVTNRWPRSLPPAEVLDDIPLYRLPFRLPHRSLRGRLSYPVSNRRISRSLHAILRQHEIDVLHVQCVSSNAHYALRAKHELGIPLVVTAQGELTMDASQAFQRDAIMADVLQRAMEGADLVTACSAKTLADVERFLGHELAGAQVIYNGADVRAFAEAPPVDLGFPYVLSIGRLVPQKGFDVLLRAWAAIDHDDVRLVIAGEGPERDTLARLTRDLGVDSSVRFFGPATRAAVPGLFAGSKVVVVPSRADEGLPLVSIEAMASGRPLISTRSGGIAEVITHGIDGIIVEREDEHGLALALHGVLADERYAAEIGRAGKHRAARLDWDVLADAYVETYSRAVESRAA
jgi:glycosyltransferase involved in cell wall biosynthesis